MVMNNYLQTAMHPNATVAMDENGQVDASF